MKIRELMIDEDGQVSQVPFELTVGQLEEHEWMDHIQFGQISSRPQFLDNYGKPLDGGEVEKYEKFNTGKKGIYVEWSVEYDASYWFIEIDSKEVAGLLTSRYKLLRDIGKLTQEAA